MIVRLVLGRQEARHEAGARARPGWAHGHSGTSGRERGLAAKGYGSALEIDHIVSLELGGSNDLANLFPEEASFTGRQPGFHVKDKLENAVHKAVCAGTISLRSAQQKIASNWELLYKKLFGAVPTG